MEADLKTFQELGVYGMTALTCIVAQNPNADWAHEIYPIETAVIEKQLVTILQGIGCDAMKTGMLGSADLVELIAATIDKYELKMSSSTQSWSAKASTASWFRKQRPPLKNCW